MAELFNRDFGFILFDDPKGAPRGGWASIAGHTAERVSSVHELRGDVVWLSNIGYGEFKTQELNRIPWLRSNGYLPINPELMLREWGVDPKTAPEDKYAKTVSQCFSRIARIAYDLMRKIEPHVAMSTAFVNSTLVLDLGAFFAAGTFAYGDALSAFARDQGYQTYTSVKPPSGAGGGNWGLLRLRKSRVAFTTELLQTPVPKEGGIFYDRRALAQKFGADALRRLCDGIDPCLAEVVVTAAKNRAGHVFNFGTTANPASKAVRSWAPHPELVVLNEVADIELKTCFIGSEMKVPMAEMPEAVIDFLGDENVEYSWSAGIVAEAIRKAYATKEDEKRRREVGLKAQRSEVSWEALWVKSSERVGTFMDAHAMTKAGHNVSSYSSGSIRCRVPPESVGDYIRDGMAAGLLPDLVDVPVGFAAGGRPEWGGDSKSLYTAWLHFSRNIEVLWALDEMPLLSPAQRTAIIQKMKQARAAG